MRVYMAITLTIACFATAASQQASVQPRAQLLAASFSKHKDVLKEKHGVARAKYKDVQSEPIANRNIKDYSGVYEVSDLGHVIEIQVGSDGRVNVIGYDKGQPGGHFELANAKIEGALLSATKVYDDGSSERFEGVFITRTVRTSPTDKGVATFGLGVLLEAPIEVGGLGYDKVFYQLRRTQ